MRFNSKTLILSLVVILLLSSIVTAKNLNMGKQELVLEDEESHSKIKFYDVNPGKVKNLDSDVYLGDRVVAFNSKRYRNNWFDVVLLKKEKFWNPIVVTKNKNIQTEYNCVRTTFYDEDKPYKGDLCEYRNETIEVEEFPIAEITLDCEVGHWYKIYKHDDFISDPERIKAEGYYYADKFCTEGVFTFPIESFSSYTQEQIDALQAGLTNYWSFDSGLNDDWGSADFANVGTTNITAKIDDGRNFDRSNTESLANTNTNVFSGNGARTTSMWVYFNQLPDGTSTGEDTLFSSYGTGTNGGKYELYYENNSGNYELVLRVTSGNRAWNVGDLTGGWKHIVLTLPTSPNTNNAILYVDNVEQTVSVTGARSINTQSSNWRFGQSDQNNDRFFDGRLDEFGVWNRALNSTEIDWLYQGGIGFNPVTATQNVTGSINITALNVYDDSSINDFNITVNTIAYVIPNNITESGNDFNGTFTNTSLGLNDRLELNESNLTGSYTSQVIDLGQKVAPDRILLSANPEYQNEFNLNEAKFICHFNSSEVCEGSGGTPFRTKNVSYVNGLFNTTAVYFDLDLDVGISYNVTPANLSLGDNGTLEFWFKAPSADFWDDGDAHFLVTLEDNDDGQDWITIATRGGGNEIRFELKLDGGNHRIDYADTLTTSLADDWHHYAVTWGTLAGGDNFTAYIDGTQVGTVALADPALYPSATFLHFGMDDNFNNYANGTFEEFAFTNELKSQEEIFEDYARNYNTLDISVRSCNDENCMGEPFDSKGILGDYELNDLATNRYFQYKADYYRLSDAVDLYINNVTFFYNTSANTHSHYSTTTGTISIPYNDNPANITWESDGYFDQEKLNFAYTGNYQFQSYGSILNLTAKEILTNITIENPTFNASSQTSSDVLYVDSGVIPVTFNKNGYYELTQNFTTPELAKSAQLFEGVYSDIFNLSAINIYNNTGINNFNISILSLNIYEALTTNVDSIFNDVANTHDNNLSTEGSILGATGAQQRIDYNYTKVPDATGASYWLVFKHGSLTPKYREYSIPSECYDAYDDEVIVRLNTSRTYVNSYCFNGSNWVQIGNYSGGTYTTKIVESQIKYSLDNKTYETTTGNNVLLLTDRLYAFEFSSNNYFSQYKELNKSNLNYSFDTYQAILNIEAREKVTNNKLQDPNFTINNQSDNSTLYSNSGAISVDFVKTGYYNVTELLSVSPVSNDTYYIEVFDAKVNVLFDQSVYDNGTLDLRVDNDNYGFSETISSITSDVDINLTSGDYNFTIVDGSEDVVAFSVSIPSGESVLSLESAGFNIIEFLYADTSAPIYNASVIIEYPNGDDIERYTNASGEVAFLTSSSGQIQTGTYNITFNGQTGFVSPVSFQITKNLSELPFVDSKTVKRANLTIYVYNRGTGNLADFNVTVSVPGLGTKVNDTGEFYFTDRTFINGSYNVYASSDVYTPTQKSFIFSNQEQLTVSLYVYDKTDPNIGTIYVEVVDSFYNILPGALTILQEYDFLNNQFDEVGRSNTDSNGEARYYVELEDKTYRIYARYEIGDEVVEGVSIEEGSIIYEDGSLIRIYLDTTATIDYDPDYFLDLEIVNKTVEETVINGSNTTIFYHSVDFVDISGLDNEVCLSIYEVQGLSETLLNEDCVTSSSGTVNFLGGYSLVTNETIKVEVTSSKGNYDTLHYSKVYPGRDHFERKFALYIKPLIALLYAAVLALALYLRRIDIFCYMSIILTIMWSAVAPSYVSGGITSLTIMMAILVLGLAKKKDGTNEI